MGEDHMGSMKRNSMRQSGEPRAVRPRKRNDRQMHETRHGRFEKGGAVIIVKSGTEDITRREHTKELEKVIENVRSYSWSRELRKTREE